MKIYHNPRCSKSRQTLNIINEKGADVEVIEYLKEPPTADELDAILHRLGLEPLDIIRRGEEVFKHQFKGKELSRDQWISAMVENPILIERPIVVKGDKAVMGRPPENVLDLL